MSDASNYLRNELLDHITNVGAWTAPAALYMALLSSASAASDDPVVNASKELSGSGYARQLVTMATASASGQIANTAALTYGAATGDWVKASHLWIVDSSSGAGNILLHVALANEKTVLNTGTLVFAIGELKFTLV